MAWTVVKGSRVHVQWREGARVRSRSVGSSDPRLVAVALRRAEALERASERAAAGGDAPARSPKDVLLDFLADRERRNVRPGTLRFYRGHLRPLFTAWGTRPWEEWTRGALETWIDERRAAATRSGKRVPGPAAVAALVRAVRALIAWAKETGALVPDFLAGLKEPLVDTSEPEPLSEDQVLELVRAAPNLPVRLVIALAGYVGLRRAEILRVTWADVDLGAKLLRVVRKARTVLRLDIHPGLGAVLAEAAAALRLAGEPLEGNVVRGVSCQRDFTADLRAAYATAKIPYAAGRPLHVLRHSLASNLFARGVPAHVVRDVMGHASLKTTDRYSHSRADERRSALLGMGTMNASKSTPVTGA